MLRITHDPAPRLLYAFEEDTRDRRGLRSPALLERVRSGDLPATELILGGSFGQSPEAREIAGLWATVLPGVRAAAEEACTRIASAPEEA